MRHTRGPLLTIDVGRREASETAIDAVCSAFIGGRGVGTKLATDRLPRDADPLGPANRLYVSTGPLQTSNVSFTGRTAATSLSPLTDGLLSSNAGGFVSRNIAATGYAAIEVTGQSDTLLAVHVSDQGVEFESVPELAGAEVSAVSEYVQKTRGLGPDSIACIGPAGENEVRFAAIVTSGSRVFGRGGLGAVLGAKRRKISHIYGRFRTHGRAPVGCDGRPPGSRRERPYHEATGDRQPHRVRERDRGVADPLLFGAVVRRCPGHRRRAGGSEKHRTGTCSACAFACKLPTRDDATGLETEGPEFETIMGFGSNAGIDEIVEIMRANDRCDELGLDTISCGDVVSAYLASRDEFGNADLVHETVEKIGRREGIGDVLAAGIDRCHDELGVENWTMKGMEFAAHDGRALNGQALAFATANRGADHLYGSMYVLEYPLVDNEAALDPDGRRQGLDTDRTRKREGRPRFGHRL